MLKNLELADSEFLELADFCRREGIVFLSTPYGTRGNSSACRMQSPGDKNRFRFGGGEPRFLQEAASLGVPLIVSTGMMSLAEVAVAAETLSEVAPDRYVLLQCVTNYPATVGSSNLRAMQLMGTAFQCPVGFSDHTETMIAGTLAVGMVRASWNATSPWIVRRRPGPSGVIDVRRSSPNMCRPFALPNVRSVMDLSVRFRRRFAI